MAQPETRLTVDAYLEHEHGAAVKSEFVDGRLFAMGGASTTHNVLTLNMGALLWNAVRGSPCRAFVADMKVRPSENVFYYPDVLVTCEQDLTASFARSPCLIVEVLSPSTAAIDRGEKLHHYTKMPSLEAYVLVSQDEVRLDVFRRGEGGKWVYDSLGEEDALELTCPKVTLAVTEIYENVPLHRSDEPFSPPRLGS